ncbi:D-aminoacyl-tRNA deacylase [Devosia naphthalenivorans]|uniref:D-aminoacyl-tRNA deacylase n=1 Tax=Devosia naphthalenivorans TaxID=2082392 RepID=UPI000D3A3BA9|nr:D-aminoacyl-tRNA deacylase [Devosia naphthalenivorans]
MRALVQRVATASVVVDDEVVGQIEHGYLVLVCAMQGDTEAVADWLAQKVVKLRVLKDGDGRMNRSVLDVGGSALIVSQFTLAAETRGNRPGFSRAALPEQGRLLYERFAETMSNLGVPVVTGIFGADMKVSLVNDGPVTIWLDTDT